MLIRHPLKDFQVKPKQPLWKASSKQFYFTGSTRQFNRRHNSHFKNYIRIILIYSVMRTNIIKPQLNCYLMLCALKIISQSKLSVIKC